MVVVVETKEERDGTEGVAGEVAQHGVFAVAVWSAMTTPCPFPGFSRQRAKDLRFCLLQSVAESRADDL